MVRENKLQHGRTVSEDLANQVSDRLVALLVPGTFY
jgi:hypothetical protein